MSDEAPRPAHAALAFLNGRLLPRDQVTLAAHDAGVVSGATVTDFCRTFAGRLYHWDDHLARFRRDCATCFIPLNASDREMTEAANRLVEHNAALAPGAELALVRFATPGPVGLYAGAPGEDDGPPTLVMHTLPLSAERYRPYFTQGVALAVAGTHGTGGDDLAPPSAKHRSRLHWWRAGHLLRRRPDVPPGALALLLGSRGQVTETAVGNVLIARDGELFTPHEGDVLDGVSLRVVGELCQALAIPLHRHDLSLADLQRADEAMLCGTAFCLAGVSWVEGTPLPWPGPITQQLLSAWSEQVGVDIAGQFGR